MVALYGVNAYLRKRHGVTDAAIWLSVIGIALLGVSGWLGGKFVYEHGVAVDPVPREAQRGAAALRRRKALSPRGVVRRADGNALFVHHFAAKPSGDDEQAERDQREPD